MKLKTCPCCRGESVMRRNVRHGCDAFYVQCCACGLMTKTFETPEQAAESWNTRDRGKKHDDTVYGCMLQSNEIAREAEEEIRK